LSVDANTLVLAGNAFDDAGQLSVAGHRLPRPEGGRCVG
jgi:hypothetical protein